MELREFDNFEEALEFIENNSLTPPRKTPGIDELLFVPNSGTTLGDLAAALARLGVTTHFHDDGIYVRNPKNLNIIATIIPFNGSETYLSNERGF